VLEAALWAASGQSALIVGALLVARFRKLTEPRWLGLVMAFGAGALIVDGVGRHRASGARPS
jgi:hypothetical protein